MHQEVHEQTQFAKCDVVFAPVLFFRNSTEHQTMTWLQHSLIHGPLKQKQEKPTNPNADHVM